MKKTRKFYASPPKVLPGDEVYALNTRYKRTEWEHGTVIRIEARVVPGTREDTYTLSYCYAVRIDLKNTKSDFRIMHVSGEEIEPCTVEEV